MNVLFFTIADADLDDRNAIYGGLLRFFIEQGHHVYIVSALERKYLRKTYIERSDSYEHLFVRTPNLFQTSNVEKGLAYLSLERLYRRAIVKYWKDQSFDLILYSTPPPIFGRLVRWSKRKWPKAISYMMLKDIFPQNAVDLGMLSPRGLAYKIFKRKEVGAMQASDYIGCMSPANVAYVKSHYPAIDPSRVELCPNTTFPTKLQLNNPDREAIRSEYKLPQDVVTFIYGGNLGKPQGIPHLLDCMKACRDKACYFVIIGRGTEFERVKNFLVREQIHNAKLLSYLPSEQYNKLVEACDVGLICLDNRFTFPNFPSRLLSYQRIGLPVMAVTDKVSDVGLIAEENGFGKWCPADSVMAFAEAVDSFIEHKELLPSWGTRGHQYMLDHYTHEVAYNAIVSHFKD